MCEGDKASTAARGTLLVVLAEHAITSVSVSPDGTGRITALLYVLIDFLPFSCFEISGVFTDCSCYTELLIFPTIDASRCAGCLFDPGRVDVRDSFCRVINLRFSLILL